ncbi:MAG: site-specific integrase [Dehalococcoidia bacterium]
MPKSNRTTVRKPAHKLHKPSGRGRVQIGGKSFYTGPWGTVEAEEKYDELVTEWMARRDVSRAMLTVEELALLYMEHAETYYQKNGEPTTEVAKVRAALLHLVDVHGRTRVRDFGPKALKDVRQKMIDAGWCRRSVNEYTGRIKRIFRWAVENELAPVEIHQALLTVSGLRAGRCNVRDLPPVRPVPEGTVANTLPFLPPAVQAMVKLQLLCGARPTEVCMIRPCDVTIGKDAVWCYRPARHKTEHHGKDRRVYIGPEGQDVLRPFLDRDPEAYCFSPAESEALRSAERRAKRRSPMTPSQQQSRKPKRSRKRPPRACYSKDAYNRAIARACEVAFGMPAELRKPDRHVQQTMADSGEAERQTELGRLKAEAAEWRRKYVWSPNQLRHTRATILRERYGIEAAQLVLGHSDPRITEIYAERDFAAAAKIMGEVG